jgi:hypothetical protein
MSETSTLISCTGKITQEELAQIPTLPSTAAHIPIPHAAVVEALVVTLSHRQISVVDKKFAVSEMVWKNSGSLTWPRASRDADSQPSDGRRCRTGND